YELGAGEVLGHPRDLRHVADVLPVGCRVPYELTIQVYLPTIPPHEPEQALDERRLAGPVRADYRGNTPRAQSQVQPIQHLEASECLAYPLSAHHECLRMAGSASMSPSGVSAGNTRSAASSRSTRKLRNRA